MLQSPLNTLRTLTADMGGGGGITGVVVAGGLGPEAWGVAEVEAEIAMITNSSSRRGAQSVTIVTCGLYHRVSIENEESKGNYIFVTKDRVTKLSTKLLSNGRHASII